MASGITNVLFHHGLINAAANRTTPPAAQVMPGRESIKCFSRHFSNATSGSRKLLLRSLWAGKTQGHVNTDPHTMGTCTLLCDTVYAATGSVADADWVSMHYSLTKKHMTSRGGELQ